jgi:hypothetical protein
MGSCRFLDYFIEFTTVKPYIPAGWTIIDLDPCLSDINKSTLHAGHFIAVSFHLISTF